MLTNTRRTSDGFAWLNDGLDPRTIRVRGWSDQPEVGALSFFAPNFALSAPRPWLVGEETTELAEVARPLPQLKSRQKPSDLAFHKLHAEIIRRIQEDGFKKVVPLIYEEFEFSAPLTYQMFASALTPGPNEYSYGFDFSEEGLCGVTPELLFQVKEGILTTMALAGTGAVNGPSLLENPKERTEHQLVIDHIESELKDLGAVEIQPTVERSYRRLKHLFTPIEVRLNREVEFGELVLRLHPTAALGGWPRKGALKWLEQQDFHALRRRFGAPFGFQSENEMRCVVAIRALQWTGNKALMCAGCGIVEQSLAANEWNELQLKLAAIRGGLGFEL